MKILPNHTSQIHVTGMGAVTPFGIGIPALTQALQAGDSRFTKSTRFDNLTFPLIMAELSDFSFEYAIEKYSALPKTLLSAAYKLGRRAPLIMQTSLISALEAWLQSRLHERQIDSTRIGLVIAGQNLTQGYQYNQQNDFKQGYLSPTYALHFMDTDHVGTLSELFNIHGEGFSIGGASASGTVGILNACRLIQQGLIDICLVVGVLADLSPLEVSAFYNIGAMGSSRFQDQPMQACRPFDTDHDGFIWGQASACLILESRESANSLNSTSLGEIIGGAMVLDANRSSNPNCQGECRAMQKALDYAAVTPEKIEYINTHGSASALGDETEVAAISQIFGKNVNQIWMNSTKSLIGHSLWSAGVVEAIATLLQMQHNFVHANLNLDNAIDSYCRFVGKNSEPANINTAMSNSFGFGGINASLILRRGIK